MSQLHDLPSVAQSVDPAIREPLSRVIQAVRVLSGFSRDPYARALTVRDAQAGGVTVTPGVTVPIGGGTVGTTPDEPDLTPPPTVTGLSISAGFSYVFVEWDPPTYAEGRGHLRTNIYAATRQAGDPLPTFSDAQRVYSAPGSLTNAAIPSEMNTIWHVWAKWETVDEVESISPAGGANGVTATTGQDVGQLLDVLSGEITASQLHSTLGARIDLIDAAASVSGSVNQRIAAVQAQVNDLIDTPAYDNAATYNEDDLVTYEGGLYRALGTTTGNLPTNLTYWMRIGDYASLSEAVAAHALQLEDHETRITSNTSGVSAEVTAREALAAQIRGSYTGTDPSALTTGLMYNERQVRVTAEGAIVSSVSTLATTVTNNYNTLNTAITNEVTNRSTAVAAEATSRQALSTAITGLANPAGATLASLTSGLLFDERTARSTADGTLTTSINSVSARLNSGGDVSTAIVNAQTTASTALTNAGTAQSTANSVATSLTTLQASIANAGANLLPNSSFEVDTSADGLAAGWGVYNNSSGTEPSTFSLVAGRLGGFAQRLAWAGANTTTKGFYTDAGFIEGGIQGGIRGGWQPNRTYVVSCWARASSGVAGTLMGLQWNIAPASTVALANPPLSVSAWQRYAFRITTGATVEGSGRLYWSIAYGAPVNGYIEIDDAMVQEGDLLTGYAPGDEAALTASLQIEATTRASQTGALFSQYTVKTDINGYVSGYGLASTSTGAAPTSSFIVRSDSFSVSSPSGPGITPITPFIVRTTPTTINGVAVPVGIYMSSAYLQNGEITNAKIGNAQIDDAKIVNLSVSKLTAGSLAVGQHIRSTNFVAGASGFNIPADGSAEFNNVTVRGTVHATAGTFAGALSGATGTFAGALSAATGTFTGSLSAATGTFAGTYTGFLNADQINAGALRGRNVNASSHTTSGSFLTSATAGGESTVFLHNTDDFPSSGTAYVRDTLNDRDSFTYTAKTSTSLTGCSGVLAHTNGATVMPAAKGMAIDSKTNEMIFLGDRGDGVVTELANIGINSSGSDYYIISLGSTAAGNSRGGIISYSNTGRAVHGVSLSEMGVFGQSTSNNGVFGLSSTGSGVLGASFGTGFAAAAVVGTNGSSGPGVYGISSSGYGGRFLGNATRAPLHLGPLGALPTVGEGGAMAVVDGYLYFHNGSQWMTVLLGGGGGGGGGD